MPLIGGSGGGGVASSGGFRGSCQPTPNIYASGGEGGGAIAIISSSSITISGAITANGGNSGGCDHSSGAGSGGAIRLAAQTIAGAGVLSVVAGGGQNGGSPLATPGRLRLEAFQQQFTGTVQPNLELVSMSTPFSAFVPTASVRVTRVSGIVLPPNPRASFNATDVTINQTGAVTLDIEAKGIPVGTIVNLEVYSENPTNSTIVIQVVPSTPLLGSLALSAATASFSFPSGYSRAWVRASWIQ